MARVTRGPMVTFGRDAGNVEHGTGQEDGHSPGYYHRGNTLESMRPNPNLNLSPSEDDPNLILLLSC